MRYEQMASRGFLMTILPCAVLLAALALPHVVAAGTTTTAEAETWVEEGLAMGPEALEEAAKRYQGALEHYEMIGDADGLRLVHLLLAAVAAERGDAEVALFHFDRCLAHMDAAEGSRHRLSHWLVETLAAEIELERGAPARSLERAQNAAALLERGERWGPELDTSLLEAYSRQGYCPHTAGWRGFVSLSSIQQALVRAAFQDMNRYQIGLGQRALGSVEAAFATFTEAKKRHSMFKLYEKEIDEALLELADELDRPDARRQALESSIAQATQDGDWRREVQLRRELATVACAQGASSQAAQELDRARDLAELVDEEALAAEIRGQRDGLACARDGQ